MFVYIYIHHTSDMYKYIYMHTITYVYSIHIFDSMYRN